MYSWLKAVVVSLLALATSLWEFPACPGLLRKPEPRHEPWNIKYAKQLAQEIRAADAGKGLELIFYGDSITEQWRGTDQGGVCARCVGDPQIFKRYFGQYRAGIFAVGGDQIGHLLWRLQHGDIPKNHHPRVAVLLIGINDLGAAADCSGGNDDVITEAADGVTKRLKDTIALLQDQLPDTRLLVLALWPRGDGKSITTTYQWPGRYTPAILEINSWLEKHSEQDKMVTYLDCGDRLLHDGQIVPAVQIDGLHPTPIGMELVSQCISPVVDKLMAEAKPTSYA